LKFTFLGSKIPRLGDGTKTIFGTNKQGTAYYLSTVNQSDINALNLNFNNCYTSTIAVTFNKSQGTNPKFGGLSYTLRSGSGTSWIYESPINQTSVPDNSFKDNINLTNVSIPSTVTSIGVGAFSGCSGLTGSLKIPDDVTSIGNDAFNGCSGFTGDLKIPISVTSIGAGAFTGCSKFTGGLTIPFSVTSIGDNTFNGCSGFAGDLTIQLNVTSIGKNAFDGCLGFTGKLTIGSSVTSIGDDAFNGCSGFVGVLTIPYSVKTIGKNAFDGCSKFTGLIFTNPSSVTSIGDYAFSGCSGFTGDLTIPDSVKTIGDGAFYDCSGFDKALIIGKNVETIGDYAFSGCSNFIGLLTISSKVTSIGKNAFNGCLKFTGLTIGSSVTSIGDYAFSGCSGFNKALIIENKVETIGDYAFSGCSKFIGSLTIPDSVTSIGKNAFNGCLGFTGLLTIGKNVKTIGSSAFNGCSKFTGSLAIPDSVTSIGDGVFNGCLGFTGSLTIGKNVKTIGNDAFNSCKGFTGSLTIPDSVTSIGGGAFYNCLSFTGSLKIGFNVKTIFNSAFYGCAGFTGSLTIPDSVTSIGEYAFYGCSKLSCQNFNESLFIPSSVISIGKFAFGGCSNLLDFTFYGSTIPTLGDSLNTIFGGNTKQGNANYLSNVTDTSAINRNFSSSTCINNIVATFNNDQGMNPTFGGLRYKLRSGSGTTWIYDSSVSSSVPDNSFYNKTHLIHIFIPSSVTTIGEAAFYGCSGLSGQLIIPSSVTTIGYNVFSGCSGLNGSLTIPSSVRSIGDGAFYNCSGLTGSLTIPSSVTNINPIAFLNCSGLTGPLTIPSSVTSIYDGAFAYCSKLTGPLTIPSSVTSISYGAFYGCPSLTQFTFLGSTIPTLGYTFFGVYINIFSDAKNPNIKQGNAYYLPTVNRVGINALSQNFNDKQVLTTVTSSTNFGQSFNSQGVTYNSIYAATGATATGATATGATATGATATGATATGATATGATATGATATGPPIAKAQVQTNSVFVPLTATASFPANPVPSLTSRALVASTDTYKYMSPPGLTSIPANSFTGNTSIIEIQLSDIVQTIGANAFSGCTELTAPVAFPASVTSIGANAFQGTPALTFTFLGDTIPTLGDGTTGIFGTDSQATAYYLPTATNIEALLTSFASSNPIPPPTVTDVYPNTGPSNGGQQVTITGTNFIDPVSISVMFGTTSAPSITLISETEISVLTPEGSGEVPVIVTTLVDSSVSNPIYTYIPSPIIASITPNTLSTSGGETITITGQNFIEPVTVTMDGMNLSIVSLTDTEIQTISVERSAGPVNITITTPEGTTSSIVIYTVPCFAKGSKILYYNKTTKKEEYKVIESLRKGDLVKTLNDGFIPIHMIGYKDIYNTSDNHDERMLYKCSTKEYPELFEDLIITGHHSILVDNFKPGERDAVLRVLGDIFVTNKKYRLPACVDKRATPFLKEGIFTVYHFSLENVNGYKNYGVYANGLLVETISKRYLRDLPGMHFIE
jgi:hypothetical protein